MVDYEEIYKSLESKTRYNKRKIRKMPRHPEERYRGRKLNHRTKKIGLGK